MSNKHSYVKRAISESIEMSTPKPQARSKAMSFSVKSPRRAQPKVDLSIRARVSKEVLAMLDSIYAVK